MKLTLPQYDKADDSVRNPQEYQRAHFTDLSNDEVRTVLLQLLEAMGLQVQRVNGQLELNQKD